MDTIRNDTKIGFRSGIGGGRRSKKTENPWVPVVEGPHGVEEMRDHGGTSLNTGDCFFICRLRVPDGDGDAEIAEGSDG